MKAFFNVLAISGLVISICATGPLFLSGQVLAQGDSLCEVDADVVLLLDVSGSMEDGSPSRCSWYKFEWVGPSKQCVFYSQDGLTQEECLANPSPVQCSSPAYTPEIPVKIVSAKSAANSFVDNLMSGDQSALVTFSDTAQLVKSLSANHIATKTAIGAATTGGSTNIGDAIAAAVLELSSANANPRASKTIILLTDGKANRPNGSGMGENPLDVAYAEQKAGEAAALGYKIFTIGLGTDGDINAAMLQNIANITGAEYHPAPDGTFLADIYQEISEEICQNYGSISGCKYNDLNNNGTIDPTDTILPGWEIVLSGNSSATQSTDATGCYTFAGLTTGSYTVSEGANANSQPFTKTYPAGDSYSISISNAENIIGRDFANYFPGGGQVFYAITASSGANGSISPSGSVSVSPGSNQAFVIAPNPGYGVADVLVDGVSMGAITNYTFSNITANHTISASFSIRLAPPTADPPAGTYTSPQSVILGSLGASSIHYTTNGTDPTCSAGDIYSTLIPVPSDLTIKAIACYGSESSTVASFAYIINECVAGEQRACSTGQPGVCATGSQTCSSQGIWGQCASQPGPVAENCSDGLDNDCDGKADGNDSDCGGGGGGGGGSFECTFGQQRTCTTAASGICSVGTQVCSTWGYWEQCASQTEPVIENCSDGLDNDCDGKTDNDDFDCGAVPGGGASPQASLNIFDETTGEPTQTMVITTWKTNLPATSRVVYDTVSHSDIGSAPNYGYALSTIENPGNIDYHVVLLMELQPNTTYYWRPVSHDGSSGEVLGKESSFTTTKDDPIETGVGGPIGLAEPAPGAVGAPDVVVLEPGSDEPGESLTEEQTPVSEEYLAALPQGGLIGFIKNNSCRWFWWLFLIVIAYLLYRLYGWYQKRKLEKENTGINT